MNREIENGKETMRIITLPPDIEQVEQKVNQGRSQAFYVVTACSLPNSALHRIAAW